MLEINDLYAFEGIPMSEQKPKELEEEKEKDVEDTDDIFVHEHDELQKSMIVRPRKTTVMMPKSKLKLEDKNVSELQNKKLEKSFPEKEIEIFNANSLDLIKEEDDRQSGIFDYHQLLNIEDPFMRVSRPSFNYRRISAFEQRELKKKKGFLFKKSPKKLGSDKKISRFSNNLKIEDVKPFDISVNIIDEDSNNLNKIDKSEKIEELQDESKEEEENNEDMIYIDLERPSFYSSDSYELEYAHFEIEIVDSVAMTVLQVINCMIKANLVQMAVSMKNLGLIWGPITICLIAVMSLISLHLVLEVNRITGQRSYLIFSEMIVGHFGSFIILICQFMSAFGGCLSYIVIFNKVVPKLLNFSIAPNWFPDDKIFTAILGIILFIYCHEKDVNILKSAAKYAVFAILSFFFLTIIDFIVTVLSQDKLIDINNQWNKEKRQEILNGLNRSKYPFKERASNIITAVACIILSYSYHIYTFSIYGSMGKISRKQYFITTSVSVLITTIIYLICGTIGYLLYYDYLTDSILDAVQESWLSSLLSIANVVNVIMTFPISFNAVKNYFILFIRIMINLIRNLFLCTFSFIPKVNNMKEDLIIRTSKAQQIQEKKGYLMSGALFVKIPKYVEFILTIIIFSLVFLFASLYTKLKVIFSFTGGVMGNILSFIFPSFFYLVFSFRKGESKYAIVAIFFIIFGTVTMAICLASTIQKL